MTAAFDHKPNDPDDLSYATPNRPSELASLTDDELFRLLHKVAFANKWPFDAKVQFEATARLIAALKDFKVSLGGTFPAQHREAAERLAALVGTTERDRCSSSR